MRNLITFLLFGVILVSAMSAQNSGVPIVVGENLTGGVQDGKWMNAEQTFPKMKDESKFILIGFKENEKRNLAIYSQDGIVLIAHNNYLIGGTKNGKWLKDSEVSENVKKPTKFFGFDSFKNEKPTDIYGTISEMLGCGAYYFYFGETEEVPENVFDDESLKPVLAIGANAKWNPLPRTPKKIALTNKTYQKIALDFLKTKGMKINSVNLENVFSVDLEGDGTDEVFIEGTNYKDENGEIGSIARAGDYSFVLMRKIINGKAKNVLIAGEFNPKKPDFDDYFTEVDLSAIADLNGDGKWK